MRLGKIIGGLGRRRLFLRWRRRAGWMWRRMIREKLLLRQQEEAALLPEEEEEVSEYETDSEEAMTGAAILVKAVFVPKSERDTIAEREKVEDEERAVEEEVRRRIEKRKRETKEIVVEKIKQDLEIQRNMDSESNIVDVDTDDEVNEAEEYEAWNVRQIAVMKRDREEREAMLKEKVRNNMTEEEERKNPKPSSQSKQKKQRFMQKYYHKGVFFQSDAEDYTRDFSSPTVEDKMDKTILPKVMQVKRFGRSGRTKWTHLVNEDTTMILFRASTIKEWLE